MCQRAYGTRTDVTSVKISTLIMYSIQTGIQNSLHGHTIHREYVMHQGYTHNLLMYHAEVLKRADALMSF